MNRGFVRGQARPAGIFQVHSEILENFQPLRAVPNVLLQPRRHALSESRCVQIVVPHVREHHKPVRITSLHHRHCFFQFFSRSAAQVHHDAQIDGVHFFDEPVHFFWRGIPMMTVNIDERKFRPLDLVLLGDQRGLRLVLVNRRRLVLFLRTLLLLRRCRAWPNDERSKCGNENDGEKGDGSPGIHSAPWVLECPAYFPTGKWTSALESSLLESAAMPSPTLFRFLLLAALAVTARFLALAIAVPIDPQVPAPLIALFSPGLKLADPIMPETHKSLAWTFGCFLRIAIAANAAFYFAIFALIAYLADRPRSK